MTPICDLIRVHCAEPLKFYIEIFIEIFVEANSDKSNDIHNYSNSV